MLTNMNAKTVIIIDASHVKDLNIIAQLSSKTSEALTFKLHGEVVLGR